MRRTLLVACWAIAVLLTLATPASGQEGFFFGPPRTKVALRSGLMLHRAGGDLFDFFRSELTLDRSDMLGPSATGEVGIYAAPRLDLVLGVGVSRAEPSTEVRDWLDENDQPIRQTTLLQVVPVTASLRFYPLSRGRRISSLAWIPARTTPYIGAGGGIAWYRLRQSGEFVQEDPETDSGVIFADDFASSSTLGIGHVFGGVEYWWTKGSGISLEGRYNFARATPEGDFSDWDTLDLSGLQLSLGVLFRW